ncbi:hypothetical protein Glove_293g5 [Diversispora epigaea]|uniref:Uncharacterized protein n=1 Tax=Diversispora epigaea TaxID=1348612 RepID=A0A397I1D7_9GLOM|nr:hypothetical protein Glove_293g5 [Diversispora epigaea]
MPLIIEQNNSNNNNSTTNNININNNHNNTMKNNHNHNHNHNNNSKLISSREIWKNAINTLLTALENILLDKNGMPIKSNSLVVENDTKTVRKMIEGQTSSDSMMEEFESIFGNLSPLKRKREDETNGHKNKSQKISKCLSVKLAKSLSLSSTEDNESNNNNNNNDNDNDNENESLKIENISEMNINNNNINNNNPLSPTLSLSSSSPSNGLNLFQRNIKRCSSRRTFNGKCGGGGGGGFRNPFVSSTTTTTTNNDTLDMDIVITDQQHATTMTTYESQRIQLLRHILSDPLPSDENYLNYWNNVTVTLSDWIELQAQKKNMSLLEFRIQFHERFFQMELSLVKLHNNIPKVYDEIRCSVDMFLLNADWLRCDYCKPFTQIFPQWQTLGRNLENFVQYVEIVEDMKTMVSSEYSQSGDVCLVIQKAKELLEFKKSLYGEILQQNGLTWKRLGFPVSDSWFYTTKQWLHGLAFHCLSIMNNELNKYEPTNIDDTRVAKIMENVTSCIKIIKIIVELIGTSSNKLTLTSLILATSYVEWGLSQIDRMENKVRCVEIRMMHICDNINHILHYLHIIQDADGQDIIFPRENIIINNNNNTNNNNNSNNNNNNNNNNNDNNNNSDDDRNSNISSAENQQNLLIVEKFAVALVEAGLRLCEHITKPKINTVTGPNNFVYMYSEFVVKFVNRTLEYSGLEETAELRMRPLLASLRNMENVN